jgi:hypothetical protein
LLAGQIVRRTAAVHAAAKRRRSASERRAKLAVAANSRNGSLKSLGRFSRTSTAETSRRRRDNPREVRIGARVKTIATGDIFASGERGKKSQ